MARAGRQLPVGLELAGAGERPLVGVAVDAQHPGMSPGISLVEVDQRGGELVELRLPGRVDAGLAGIEEHLRLEHEAVADDADVGPVAEHLPQAAEELGAVARQLLHLLRERHVEPRAEIGDARLRFPVARLRRPSSASSSAASWRRRAAICWLRISTWASARAETCFSASSSLPSALAWLPAEAALALLESTMALQPVLLGLGGLQRVAEQREVVLERLAVDLLERQQVGQLARSAGSGAAAPCPCR